MCLNSSTEHILDFPMKKSKAMLDAGCCIINKQALQTSLSLLCKWLLEERVAQEQMERGHLNTA